MKKNNYYNNNNYSNYNYTNYNNNNIDYNNNAGYNNNNNYNNKHTQNYGDYNQNYDQGYNKNDNLGYNQNYNNKFDNKPQYQSQSVYSQVDSYNQSNTNNTYNSNSTYNTNNNANYNNSNNYYNNNSNYKSYNNKPIEIDYNKPSTKTYEKTNYNNNYNSSNNKTSENNNYNNTNNYYNNKNYTSNKPNYTIKDTNTTTDNTSNYNNSTYTKNSSKNSYKNKQQSNYSNKNDTYKNKGNNYKNNYNNKATVKTVEVEVVQTKLDDMRLDGELDDEYAYNDIEDCYDDEFDANNFDFNDDYVDDEDVEYLGGNNKYIRDNNDQMDKEFKKDGKPIRAINRLEFDNTFGFTDYVCSNIKGEFHKSQIINDSFVNVLMIAEKPSIAKSIAEALSSGKVNNKSFGKGKCLLTFDGYFKNIKAKFTVSSVLGHVYTSDFKQEHNKWDSVNHIDLFSLPIMKLEANRKTRMCDSLQKLAYGKDILALWLDCDKEGENICFETINCCFKAMNKKSYQQIYRAKFSSITKPDLKTAFNKLSLMPNRNESSAVDARQHLDLKIGIAFTRYLTTSILPALGLETKLLSYGPCQTPTLWFCVQRSREISGFVPKQYYRIFLEFVHKRSTQLIYLDTNSTKTVSLNKEEARYLSKFNCDKIVANIMKVDKAEGCKVIDVIRRPQKKAAPAGLNTVSLLRVASSYLKISPHNTMVIAERLYTSGYTTYPRTETTKYSSSFEFLDTLKNLQSNTDFPFSSTAGEIAANFKKPVLRGTDVGDHPPITPTSTKCAKGLTGDMKRLYDLIASHFLATLMEDAVYEERDYIIEFANEKFKASSSIIVKEGYLKVHTWKKENFTKGFPDISVGETLEIKKIGCDSNYTTPPGYLTESDLIQLMEKNLIGTDASMPVHIENIVSRNYVGVTSGRCLIPTDLGNALIIALESVDEEIVHPRVRAQIERSVDMISQGKSTYKDIIGNSLEVYKKKFFTISQNHEKLLKGFSRFFNINKGNILEAIRKTKTANEKEILKTIKNKR